MALRPVLTKVFPGVQENFLKIRSCGCLRPFYTDCPHEKSAKVLAWSAVALFLAGVVALFK